MALIDSHQNQDTSNLICISGNMAGRNVSQPSGPELQVKRNEEPADTIKLKQILMNKHILSKTSSQLQPREWAGPHAHNRCPNVLS